MSKKLMPRRKARRTEPTASSSETGPKTLPRGEAPNPTELSFSPVLPSGRSSRVFAIFSSLERERERENFPGKEKQI